MTSVHVGFLRQPNLQGPLHGDVRDAGVVEFASRLHEAVPGIEIAGMYLGVEHGPGVPASTRLFKQRVQQR